MSAPGDGSVVLVEWTAVHLLVELASETQRHFGKALNGFLQDFSWAQLFIHGVEFLDMQTHCLCFCTFFRGYAEIATTQVVNFSTFALFGRTEAQH